jgi:hypothetical protein
VTAYVFLVDTVISGGSAAALSDERSAASPCGLIRMEERQVELRQIRVFEKIVCNKDSRHPA